MAFPPIVIIDAASGVLVSPGSCKVVLASSNGHLEVLMKRLLPMMRAKSSSLDKLVIRGIQSC